VNQPLLLSNLRDKLSFMGEGPCYRQGSPMSVSQMKDQQAYKIRQIKDELTAAGYSSLAQQAKVLGLSRSTAWVVLRGNHKGSGLTVSVLNRMLAAPLPSGVRTRIEEYVEEKAFGLYGHNRKQRSRFTARLNLTGASDMHVG
jgi:hypothetical protein